MKILHKVMYFILPTVSMILTSCTDRSLDDYKRDQLAKDASKLNQVVGVYAGTLVSDQTSNNIGLLGIKFEKDTVVSNLNDRSAALKASVLFKSDEPVYVVFRNIYFDPDNGTFDGYADILDGLVKVDQIHLNGGIDGTKVIGTLNLLKYPNNGASFSLEKSSETSTENALFKPSDVEIEPSESFKVSYWGKERFVSSGNVVNAEILITNAYSTAERRFLDKLSAVSSVRVSIMEHYDNGIPLTYVLNDATWNQQEGFLKGSGGSGEMMYNLECVPIENPNDATRPGLKCSYITSQIGYTADITVFPTP